VVKILLVKQTNHKHSFEEISGFEAGGYPESIEYTENKMNSLPNEE